MELSPQEKQRMSRLSQDDQLKLKAIMQMMAKEKDDIEKDARKAKGMMEQEPKQLSRQKQNRRSTQTPSFNEGGEEVPRPSPRFSCSS